MNFKPLCSLFNQSKLLPLKFVPIILEFELCDINDAIITPQTYDATTGYNGICSATNATNLLQILKLLEQILKVKF